MSLQRVWTGCEQNIINKNKEHWYCIYYETFKILNHYKGEPIHFCNITHLELKKYETVYQKQDTLPPIRIVFTINCISFLFLSIFVEIAICRGYLCLFFCLFEVKAKDNCVQAACIHFTFTKVTKHNAKKRRNLIKVTNEKEKLINYYISLYYAFQWLTDLSVKIIFDNFTVKIIKI
jgi:hypothetical protein